MPHHLIEEIKTVRALGAEENAMLFVEGISGLTDVDPQRGQFKTWEIWSIVISQSNYREKRYYNPILFLICDK